MIYNKPEDGAAKEKFAVCVKGLDFPDDDLSVRLGEGSFFFKRIIQAGDEQLSCLIINYDI